ncbi:MAG: sulfite exporter TauE/SafE family protein, partial [Myxococcales bacterium]|nr:sulfite exporter TauE/SafE family protein [Myxococcales bacterium]
GRELHDKAAFRATTATVFLPMTLGLIISYYFSGLFQPPVLRLGLLAVPVVLLGMWLGEKVYQRVEADRFKRGVWALLCVGALVLIGRAAFNMLS